MRRILITGSQGYIGSVLLPYLEGHGYECIGIDTGFFKDCLIEKSEDKTIYKDVREITSDDLKDVDVVVHLAGIANDPMKTLDPNRVYDPVREYTSNLAKICKEKEIKFIFASSCSIYGATSGEVSDENSKPNPVTPYSQNKLDIETDLIKLHDDNFKPTMLRFSTVMGFSPRIRFDIVVNMFVGMALTTNKITLNSRGLVWRPFVHIKDVCKAIKYSIETDVDSKSPTILNVGDTEENFQIIKIAEMVKEQLPECEITYLNEKDELISDRKIEQGIDKRDYKLSFEKIKKTFPGFKCDISIKDTIKELISKLKNLKNEDFRNINYYRLQKMESLLENGSISKELIWNKFDKRIGGLK